MEIQNPLKKQATWTFYYAYDGILFITVDIYIYIYTMYIYRMCTQKKNYILQLKVSRFHDHQAILQSKDQSYLLYCEIGST